MDVSIGGDAGDMPEQIQFEHPCQPGEAGEALIGEWAIQEQAADFRGDLILASLERSTHPVFQQRKVVK